MPSKSKAQQRLMQAAKHNPAFAKKVGVSQSVASEFVAADKAKPDSAKLPTRVGATSRKPLRRE